MRFLLKKLVFFNSFIRRCFLLILVLQSLFITCVKASTVTYPAGSLIIPMDSTYQDCGMWPVFGLIYQLLLNDVPVSWAIAQTKTAYNQTDFIGPTTAVILNSPIPTTCSGGNPVPANVPSHYAFTAGPYIIDGTNPATLATAISVIDAWWSGSTGQSPIANHPVIIQATSSFTANVDIVLNKAPVIAIEEVNQTIAESYMIAAGIPQSTGNPPFASGWSFIDEGATNIPGSIAGGGLFQTGNICQQRIFDVYVTPHNPGFSYSLTDPTNVGTITYAQLDNFVYLGGGWIALCYSMQTNEDSMADLTINGSASVKALFKTSITGNPGGLLLQGAPKPYSTAPPPPFGGAVPSPNAAFPLNQTQNLGSRWVPDAANLGLPIIQGMLPTPPTYPTLTTGFVESWTAPPSLQPIGVTPIANSYPTYWPATRRVSYYDLANPVTVPITTPGTTERYDSILDGTYHNGGGAGKISFFAGHWYDNPNNNPGNGPTLPYSTNVAAPYLRAFYNALFLNGNGAVKLQIEVPFTACVGENVVLNIVNTGGGTGTLNSNLVLTLAPNFTYISTNAPYPPPDTIVGQTLTWFSSTIPTIAANTTAISINVGFPPSIPLGSNQIATLIVQYTDPFGYEYTVNACTGLNIATVTTASILGTNPQSLCASTTISASLFGNSPNSGAGETGFWNQIFGPSGAIIISPSSPTTSVTGLTAANVGNTGSNAYVFEWTITSSGGYCTSSAQATLTVYQTPPQPGTISGSSIPCSGVPTTYSISPVTGATSYTWTIPSGWTGLGSQPQASTSITVTPSTTSGSISVTANFNNALCVSQATSMNVTTVQTPAAAGPVIGSISPCTGVPTIYSIAAVPNATSYAWTVPSGWTITAGQGTNSITVIPSITAGSVTVVPSNGLCNGASSASAAITPVQTPAAAGPITGSSSPCSGVSTTYSIAPVTGAASYVWTVPSGWTITGGQGTDAITVTPSTMTGFVTITPTNGACAGATATTGEVEPIQTPNNAGTITGSLSPCTGTPIIYSISPVVNATNYIWTVPSGWLITSDQGTASITVVPSITSGFVTVTPLNGVCAGTIASTALITPVQTPADAGAISGSSSPCTGISTNYSVSPVLGAASYLWTVPAGWTISSGQGTDSIIVIPSTISGSVTVTPKNGSCMGSSATLQVTPVPNPVAAGSITGSSTPCTGITIVYSILPVANATSYVWTVPSGWTISSGQGSNSITVIPSITAGSLNVMPTNGLCTGAPAFFVVNPIANPSDAGAIFGNQTPCTGIASTYSIDPVANATSYTWTVPSGWTGLSAQPQASTSITVIPSINSGTITVTPNNGICSGAQSELQVTVTATPVLGAITGNASVCFGSTNVYYTTQIPGVTYNWSFPSGWVIIGSSTGYSITAIASGISGDVTVNAISHNGICTSSSQTFAVTVNPLPNVMITPPAITIYKGTSTVLTASGANTYLWSPGALTGSSISVNPLSTTTYTVAGTDENGCVNTANATVFVVNSTIVANPDFGSLSDGAMGGTVVANVLANDSLNDSTPNLANVQLTATAPFSPYVNLNPNGSVSVIPGTPAGVYTIGYTICELINVSNCSSTTVQVTVGAASIVANPDSGTITNGANGGIAVPNVLANDTLNGVMPTLSNVNLTLTGTPNPFITLNSDGSVSAKPGTPAGVYVIGYKICEIINPTNCSFTTVTVTVDPPPIVANPNSGTVPNGSAGGIAISNILANDTLNGIPPTTSNVVITPSAPFNSNVLINSDGSVSVPSNTPAGVYTAGYTICEIVNPTNCSSTTVQITVGAASIVANPNAGTVNGGTGGIAVPNVLANDSLNGITPTLSTVTLTASAPFNSNVTLNSDGSVSVPPETPVGVYTIGYTICQIINPTNCSSTTVQVTVTASSIVANPDFGNVSNGSSGGIAVANVLANDTLNGITPDLSMVLLTPISPANPYVMLNPDGSVSAAPNTPAGVYTIGYMICEILNPVNCSSTTVQVTVGAAPIVANADSGNISDGATGGTAVENVLANDSLNGLTPTFSDVNLSAISPFSPYVNLNIDGSVSVAPGTPAGVYTIGYMICQKLNPANCSSTTVQVTVGVPPIMANPDNGTVPDGIIGGIAVSNVLVNDTLNGLPATLLNVNLSLVGLSSPYLDLNVSTGAVSAIPETPAGVYTLQYQICDKLNPTNCSTATVTVTVLVPPQPPINPEICEVKQQFAGGTDLINIISWIPPTEGPVIVAYRIYANFNLTTLIGEFPNIINACDMITFTVHNRMHGQAYVYYIVSVDGSGQMSTPTAVAVQ